MQGRPALIVRLVHRGTLLHQKAHHLQVLIDTGLGEGRKGCQPSAHPDTTHPARKDSQQGFLNRFRGQVAVKFKAETLMVLGQALSSGDHEQGAPSAPQARTG